MRLLSDHGWAAGTMLGLLVVTTGCGTAGPPKYFSLVAVTLDRPPPAAPRAVTVGLGPVELPEYLDRAPIVTRVNEHEIELAALNRWAEPLRDNVARVLRENLAQMIPTNDIVTYPWKRSIAVEYQVTVDINRFESGSDGTAVLDVRWGIAGRGEQLLLDHARYTRPADSPGYGARVAAQNGILTEFSRDIAAAINRLISDGGDE